MADIYTRFIEPYLPPDVAAFLNPYAGGLDVLTPWIVSAIVFSAALYTFYEVDKQNTRDPAIPEKLRALYVESEPLTGFSLKSEEEYPLYEKNVQIWYQGACKWIDENMSMAALSRFRDTSNILPFRHNAAVHKSHNDMVNHVNKLRSNLRDLIENEAWDKKDKKKEKKWRLANIFRSKKHEKKGD